MSSELLKKMIESKKKFDKKKNLNIMSKFETISDDEVAMVLALRAKRLRLKQKLTQKEFSKNLELNSASTYSNFEQKGTISLVNFIRVVREFGLLDQLDELFKPTDIKDVLEIYEGNDSKNKRVRKKETK
ncbi:hypothetical protein CP965_01795 [Halarcobacter mediterraneus]|uniref:HTH cro/C1-type domain-containing protein n=1 Tax=Halarcobacter mediterraneus TaxID=2023153 RepID=A0A4Q1AVX2_9BACT|nr:helix-turn-helix transcriptional regulator [Halarcobacter mediterraneus]RXK14205.1 hypothetical protein CP965_01795 [Halarcobacter mediterraneus]